MKALSIRLEDSLAKKFDQVCKLKGFKKNTVLNQLIMTYIKENQLDKKNRKVISEDPLLKVIGIAGFPPVSPEEIDKIVYGLGESGGELEFHLKDKSLHVAPAKGNRIGWDKSFQEMHENGDDVLLDENVQNDWDETEWKW